MHSAFSQNSLDTQLMLDFYKNVWDAAIAKLMLDEKNHPEIVKKLMAVQIRHHAEKPQGELQTYLFEYWKTQVR